jgi:hypothetical protein
MSLEEGLNRNFYSWLVLLCQIWDFSRTYMKKFSFQNPNFFMDFVHSDFQHMYYTIYIPLMFIRVSEWKFMRRKLYQFHISKPYNNLHQKTLSWRNEHQPVSSTSSPSPFISYFRQICCFLLFMIIFVCFFSIYMFRRKFIFNFRQISNLFC